MNLIMTYLSYDRLLVWSVLISKTKLAHGISLVNSRLRYTDFPLLMVLRALAISSNDSLWDGSSAQHCFINIETPGCMSLSTSFNSGRQWGAWPSLIFWISTAQNTEHVAREQYCWQMFLHVQTSALRSQLVWLRFLSGRSGVAR